MARFAKPKPASRKPPRRDWPAVVYLWIIGLGIVSYLVVGEFVFMTKPHAWHWGAGLVGAAIGVPVGWLWYRSRGDL